MMTACPAPDAAVGVALRFATYADCQGRALGENGYQALIGSPAIASLTTALVTIFVALIGYRLILGRPLTLSDGFARVVRLGMVLTLTTSWPAFQTLVYNVVSDGPSQVAVLILPSSGLPAEGLGERVQLAYDTMRLGVVRANRGEQSLATTKDSSSSSSRADQTRSALASFGQLPYTASAFVLSTLGVSGALQLAIGFLLAVAPFAALALMFDATLGLFSGWVRALAGAALALLASTVVTAIELVMIEGELAQQQAYSQGGLSAVVDQQALTTLTLVFAVVMIVLVALAVRMAGSVTLRWRSPDVGSGAGSRSSLAPAVGGERPITAPFGNAGIAGRSRAAALADEFRLAEARERSLMHGGATEVASTPGRTVPPSNESMFGSSLGLTSSRRTGSRAGLGRRSRRAANRDLTR